VGAGCGDVPVMGACVCGTNQIQSCLVPPAGDAQPEVNVLDCGPDAVCVATPNGGAVCKLKAICEPGDAVCEGDTLRTCKADGSGFDAKFCAVGTRCEPQPQGQAACVAAVDLAQGTPPTLDGEIAYELRHLDKNLGVTAPEVDGAFLLFVAVYNEKNEYIGNGITDGEGKFHIELAEPATAKTRVYAYALDFRPDDGQPLVAVVRMIDSPDQKPPQKGVTPRSDSYWYWDNKTKCSGDFSPVEVQPDADGPGKARLPQMVIPESCGSGAIWIFQWVRFAMYRLGDPTFGLPSTKGVPQNNVAIFWEPGVNASNGGAFYWGGGTGARVHPAGTSTDDFFHGYMQISGSQGTPSHWAHTVISHEAGHWAMLNYSRYPHKSGGAHNVNELLQPSLAYAEGWATAFSHWNVSDPDSGQFDSLYIDRQDDVTFWVDIAKLGYSGQGGIPAPSPAGALDAKINENTVASTFWHLVMPANPDDPGHAYGNVGGDAFFKAMQGQRVMNASFDRGHDDLDAVDLMDALVCAQATPGDSPVITQLSFPWDNQPTCP